MLLVSTKVATPTVLAFGRARLLVPHAEASLRDAGIEVDSQTAEKSASCSELDASSRLCETRLSNGQPRIDWVAAFTHELAHVARRDGWSRLWVELVLIAIPLQPLIWLARRDYRIASEEACDDFAVAAGTNPIDLADTLTAWMDFSCCSYAGVIGISSSKARALRLLGMQSDPIACLNGSWRMLGVVTTCLLVGGIAIAQSPETKSSKDQGASDRKESLSVVQTETGETKVTKEAATTESDDSELRQLQSQMDELAKELKKLPTNDDSPEAVIKREQIVMRIQSLNQQLATRQVQRGSRSIAAGAAAGDEKIPPPAVVSDQALQRAIADDALISLYKKRIQETKADLAQAQSELDALKSSKQSGNEDDQKNRLEALAASKRDLKSLEVKLENRKAELLARSEGSSRKEGPAKAESDGSQSLGPYIIEPPDILLITPTRLVSLKPVEIQQGDKLQIDVQGTKYDEPIHGIYKVDSSGEIVLGPSYGSLKVSGLTRRKAQEAVKTQLQAMLNDPYVALTIDESRLETGITGQHLVAPNGTINLGIYGEVNVNGQTIVEAQKSVEDKLAAQFNDPVVSVDIYGYNSKVFYVIQKGQSVVGDSIHRFPYDGNVSFLDAVAQLGGAIDLSAAKIWISRPGRGERAEQKIDINWDEASVGRGSNPQILPGDRVFIEGAHQITTQYVKPGYYVPPTPVQPAPGRTNDSDAAGEKATAEKPGSEKSDAATEAKS